MLPDDEDADQEEEYGRIASPMGLENSAWTARNISEPISLFARLPQPPLMTFEGGLSSRLNAFCGSVCDAWLRENLRSCYDTPAKSAKEA